MLRPIGERRQQQVRRATAACLQRASGLYASEFTPIPVSFDLCGRSAGMYRVQRGQRDIRYNPYLFARDFADGLANTVPHEVAHYVTDILYGLASIRPHGVEWRAVMRSLGAEPRATGNFDLSGVPVRRQRRFTYQCSCNTHRLTTCRHNRVRRGEALYTCRDCGTTLVHAEQV